MNLNKRGQELSVNTIIVIVLAILVLVFVIIGFSVGWSKIFPFLSPANNVKDVVDKCALACSTESTYDFCTSPRDVKVEQDIPSISVSKKLKGTCYDLTGVSDLGVVKCAAITCEGYSSQGYANLACGGSDKTTPAKDNAGKVIQGKFECVVPSQLPA